MIGLILILTYYFREKQTPPVMLSRTLPTRYVIAAVHNA